MLTLVCAMAVAGLRRFGSGRVRDGLLPALKELGLLSGLYSIWRLARMLPLATTGGAMVRAHWIDRFQHRIALPSELTLQRLALQVPGLGRFLNAYYAIVHVPALLACLAWLFLWRRPAYARWRTGLVLVTGFCLFIRFIRVAPPRFLPELGYIDLAAGFGLSVYGPVGTGVSDQFAAMPSIHVAWAAVVSFSIIAAGRSPKRWVFALHLALTLVAVSATGNHWWLDSIVALLLFSLCLAIERRYRQFRLGRRSMAAGEDDLVEGAVAVREESHRS